MSMEHIAYALVASGLITALALAYITHRILAALRAQEHEQEMLSARAHLLSHRLAALESGTSSPARAAGAIGFEAES